MILSKHKTLFEIKGHEIYFFVNISQFIDHLINYFRIKILEEIIV